ncbi:HesB/YadR/YfhF family protein [Cohnella faecalis]|uniref:Fe-S cluster assembly protein HesB n=1 Tax=Cohnella faecalis TaxID=2315694 RepID=A0A398CK09_9BACL|nr:Fe-S cluster assembly protein HesB [Cohnella faecalis]RIE03646.1 Fe-S cluster assembly protein HesB [Cohnella faecalis]
MELTVTSSALACFKKEWGFDEGEHIRVFVRYVSGGESPFAFGISRDTPQEAALTTTAGKLTFFVERKDLWFLDGSSLVLDCRGEDIVFHVI